MSGVIVVRKKSQELPAEYLNKVLAEHKTCMGAAVVLDHEINIGKGPAGGNLESIKASQEGPAATQDVVYYFGTHTSGGPEDEIQPYTLLEDGDGSPLIVGFFDGNFPSYTKAGSAHSDAWFLAHEFLRPLFKDYYESKGEDLDQVIKDISKPVFKMQMEKTWVDRGTITLMIANGDTYTFSANDKSADFPWGWVSNTFGFGAVAKEEPKKGWWGKGKPVDKPVPVAEPVKPVTVPTMPPKEQPKTIPATAVPSSATVQKMTCPLTITKERKVKGWYREHCGTVPPNYADHPAWPVTIGKSLEEVGAIMAAARQPDDLTNAKIQQERVKDTAPHHIPQPEHSTPTGETDPLPTLTAEQKKSIVEKFPASVVKQFLDQNSGQILDPSKIQGLESKWPTFTEEVGFKGLEETYTWSYKDLISLSKLYPEGSAMLIMQYRAALIGMIRAAKDNKPKDVIVTPVHDTTKKVAAGGSRRMM